MSHDPKIIAHLRSALDEVAATPVAHAAHPAPARRGLDARRWVAIAASAVIIAGAGVGIAMYNGDDTQQASDPTTATTAMPGASSGMPYFLAAADLAPGPVQTTTAGAADGTLLMAWVRNGDMADGLLVMNAAAFDPAAPTTSSAKTSSLVIDGSKLVFDSYGLTATERDGLVAQVVPGSGLPWLLPVDGWTMATMVTPADGSTQSQTFGGSVTVTAGPMVIIDISLLTAADEVTKVTVAGQPGWRATTADGTTRVVWREPVDGNWVSLNIPADMADRVDGLIAAVVTTNVPGITITSDTLPPFGAGTDPAIGLTAPAVIGPGLDGNAVVIDPATTQQPTLVIFVANWCPHCHALLPNVQAWIADGTIGTDVDVVVVTTAESTTAESSADWLAQLDWRTKVLIDGDNGDGQAGPAALAYGAPGWPYAVLIAADGTVAARTSGEMTQSQMQQLLSAAA